MSNSVQIAGADKRLCRWCDREFIPRPNGGRAQTFCSTHCKNQFRSALVAHTEQELASGKIGITQLEMALMQKRSGKCKK